MQGRAALPCSFLLRGGEASRGRGEGSGGPSIAPAAEPASVAAATDLTLASVQAVSRRSFPMAASMRESRGHDGRCAWRRSRARRAAARRQRRHLLLDTGGGVELSLGGSAAMAPARILVRAAEAGPRAASTGRRTRNPGPASPAPPSHRRLRRTRGGSSDCGAQGSGGRREAVGGGDIGTVVGPRGASRFRRIWGDRVPMGFRRPPLRHIFRHNPTASGWRGVSRTPVWVVSAPCCAIFLFDGPSCATRNLQGRPAFEHLLPLVATRHHSRGSPSTDAPRRASVQG
jgi:hypothetical protein